MMLRSLLFVPGDNLSRMEKARLSGADAIILDLEDSVSESNKPQARRSVAQFLSVTPRSDAPQLWVRINPISGPHALGDLAAVVAAIPDGIVLPKSDSADAVLELSHYLTALEAAAGVELGSISILPIATETPKSIFGLASYQTPNERLIGLTWGAEDLPSAVGAITSRLDDGSYTPPYELARSLCLFGAAAAQLQAIETVYPSFKNLDGLAAYTARARRDGFSGMMAIHPTQVEIINAAFTPSSVEISNAQAIVKLFKENPDRGALALNGQMLDLPHLKQAKRILEVAGRTTK